MIAHPSLHLFPCSPAPPIFIIVYLGRKRVRLRLHLQVISHRILEESISSIAIQIIRRVSELQRTSDVRKGFVDHLYHAHPIWGLLVFLDTHEINRGEDISATLHHAIEVSRILIPNAIGLVPQRSLAYGAANITSGEGGGVGEWHFSIPQSDSCSSSISADRNNLAAHWEIQSKRNRWIGKIPFCNPAAYLGCCSNKTEKYIETKEPW